MRVALVQCDSRVGDLEANLAAAKTAIGQAADGGADLIVFPELALQGYPLGRYDGVPLRSDDSRMSDLAAQAKTALAIGFHEDAGLHSYNSVAYFQNGSLLHVQRKLYLPNYDIWEERKHFTPGQALRAFRTAHGGTGILTCNDAWQPFLPFLLAQDGAELIIIPADSADTRAPEVLDTHAYWQELLRSMARMNELWAVFVNRVGTSGGLEYWGGSCVVDPAGLVIAEAPVKQEAVIFADIDLADARRRRRELPLLKDARLGFLARELARLIDAGGDA
ncbi:MAG: nitrilase-related carbon-nitrogen hydrolase [Mycobacteriales bacterium]|nr:MAG: amidohydrolase [Pseudonocardiales bacterium]